MRTWCADYLHHNDHKLWETASLLYTSATTYSFVDIVNGKNLMLQKGQCRQQQQMPPQHSGFRGVGQYGSSIGLYRFI